MLVRPADETVEPTVALKGMQALAIEVHHPDDADRLLSRVLAISPYRGILPPFGLEFCFSLTQDCDRSGHSYWNILGMAGLRQPAIAESYGGHGMPLPQKESTNVNIGRLGHQRMPAGVISLRLSNAAAAGCPCKSFRPPALETFD